MFIQSRMRIGAAAFALALVFGTPAAFAQEDPPPDPRPPSADEIKQLLEGALPDLLKEDNSELVGAMMNVQMGTPLSESFDLSVAVKALFNRVRPTFSPECAKTSTPVGDRDKRLCIAERGNAGGEGLYQQLAFGKQLETGHIRYMVRQPQQPVDPGSLRPVELSDEDAFGKAIGFLGETFGLAQEEIPLPPPGTKNPFPVRSLLAEWADEKQGKAGSVPILKVVSLQRGLRSTIPELPWLPAPGDAIVALDNSGPTMAVIRDWQELRQHPDADPQKAKSRSRLVDEMTEDILNTNKVPIVSMRTKLLLTSVPTETYSLLLPAVQVWIATQPRDPTEEQQRGMWSTGGSVEEYLLLDLNEKPGTGDND